MELANYLINYARGDADFVLKLGVDLAAAGLGHPLEPVGRPGGERRGLAQAAAALGARGRVLVLLSPAWAASQNMRDDAVRALEARQPLLLILLPGGEIPAPLQRCPVVDFRPGYGAGLERLVRELSPARTAPPRGPLPPPGEGARPRRHGVLVVGSGALVMGLATVAVLMARPDPQPALARAVTPAINTRPALEASARSPIVMPAPSAGQGADCGPDAAGGVEVPCRPVDRPR